MPSPRLPHLLPLPLPPALISVLRLCLCLCLLPLSLLLSLPPVYYLCLAPLSPLLATASCQCLAPIPAPPLSCNLCPMPLVLAADRCLAFLPCLYLISCPCPARGLPPLPRAQDNRRWRDGRARRTQHRAEADEAYLLYEYSGFFPPFFPPIEFFITFAC